MVVWYTARGGGRANKYASKFGRTDRDQVEGEWRAWRLGEAAAATGWTYSAVRWSPSSFLQTAPTDNDKSRRSALRAFLLHWILLVSTHPRPPFCYFYTRLFLFFNFNLTTFLTTKFLSFFDIYRYIELMCSIYISIYWINVFDIYRYIEWEHVRYTSIRQIKTFDIHRYIK